MLAKMSKIYVYGPKDDLSKFLSFIHDFGAMQIESHVPRSYSSALPTAEAYLDPKLAAEKRDLEDVLDKLNKILLLFPGKKKSGKLDGKDFWYLTSGLSTAKLADAIDFVYHRLTDLFGQSQSIKNDLKMLSKYRKVIDAVYPLVKEFPGSEHMDMIGLLLERNIDEALAALHNELRKLTGGEYKLFNNPMDDNTAAAVIAFPRRFSPQISKMLWEENINELKLPSELRNMPLKEAMEAVFKRQTSLPEQLKNVESEISRIFETWEYNSKQWTYPLNDLRQAVEDRIREIRMADRILLTKYSFIVTGWVPKNDMARLETGLKENFDGRVLIQSVRVGHRERDSIPVKIDNYKWLQPFQVLMDLLPPPKYGTIDPTPFLALFFPIFFGLILGDIGYGLIIMGLSLFLRKKFAHKKFIFQLSSVFLICSFFSIVFGFIFGEFFGDLPEIFLGIHPLMNRMQAIVPMLALTIAIGFTHITLGVVLGVINSFQEGAKRHFYFKLAELGTLLTILLLVASLSGVFLGGISTPLILLLASLLVVTVVTEGFIAPLEIIKDLGNILSYTRLMAIGLSSAILAFVANKFAEVPKTLAIGIIIAVLIHSINLVIGIFSPTIHSMRLHFVEFFDKFFEPGGKPYTPFKKSH